MKKIMLLMLGILLVLPLCSSYVCTANTDVEDIPCEAITPSNLNCSDNATIRDVVTPTINKSVNMTLKYPNNTYNFSFDYSNVGSYFLLLCDGSTSSINVDHFADDYNDKWFYFYGASLLLAGGLFVFGYKSENNIITLLSGFLILSFALCFLGEGYPGLENNSLIHKSIVFLSLGTGLFITGNSFLNLMNEGL